MMCQMYTTQATNLGPEVNGSAQRIIREAAAGAPWDEIVDLNSLPDPEEIADAVAGAPIKDILMPLHNTWVRAREVRVATKAILQLAASVRMAGEVLEASSWRELGRLGKHCRPMTEQYLGSPSLTHRYPPSAKHFIAGMAGKQLLETLQVATADRAAVDILEFTKERQFTAHALIRNQLDEHMPELSEYVQTLEKANEAGDLTHGEVTGQVADYIEQQTGFRVHPRIMQGKSQQLYYNKGGSTWQEFVHPLDEVSELERIDSAHFLWRLVAGYAVRAILQGTPVDERIPRLLGEVGEIASYTNRVTADQPFQNFRKAGNDKFFSYADWASEVWKGRPQKMRWRGRCPVQHSFLRPGSTPPEGSLADRALGAIEALQAYSKEEYGAEATIDNECPTIGEFVIAQAIIAWAKPGGQLDPGNEYLEHIGRDVQRRAEDFWVSVL